MPAAVQIDLPPATRTLLEQSQSWPRALSRNLVRALDLQNELTVGQIVAERATGKGPFPVEEGRLGVRTGRYRRSVRPSKAVVTGTAIESAIGSNVKYAGVHEFGFSGTVQVREHRKRHAMVDLIQVGDRVLPRWQAVGERGRQKKIASGIVRVRAHSVQMNIPARAPIRRGIADRLPHYRDALSTAIVATFTPQA